MNYYVRRTGQVIITFFSAMFLAYALYRFMPGGPLEALIAQEIQDHYERNPGQPLPIDRIQQTAERQTGINPDAGIVQGFIDYMYGVVVQQDLGQSIAFSGSVYDVVVRHMPWSILISGYGLLLGFTATLVVGTLMAWKEGTKTDSGLTVFILVTSSIPYFVVGALMLGLLGFQWGWFPQGGKVDPTTTPGFNIPYMVSVAHHATLPILSTFVVGFGGALGMRANTVRIMGSDYIRSARLRGLSSNRIMVRYLMRNAILPIYTGALMLLAGVFSSNVVTEEIFQYPAMGWILLDALEYRDYPLLMGTFIFFTGITVFALLLADFTYGLIDPRAGTGASREAY